MRLRITAEPSLRVTVKPTRGGPSSLRRRAWTPTPSRDHERARAASRKSWRRLILSILVTSGWTVATRPCRSLGRQTCPALGAATRQDPAPPFGRHAGAEAVPPLANDLRGLKSALHREILQFILAGSGGLILAGNRRVNAKAPTSHLIPTVRKWPNCH